MTPASPTPRRRLLRDDAGASLAEVLVVCTMLAGVSGALLSVLDTAASTVPRDVEWTHAVTESRTGLHRMVREVRQASVINGVTPNRIDFDTAISGTERRVMYACDVPGETVGLRRCMRVESASGTALPAATTGQTIVARVQNGTSEDPAFTFAPDAIRPTYVTARLVVPSTGEHTRLKPGHAAVLEDGATLRNQVLGG